ncbi:peptidase inhibitor family I36 protein [Streptomyces candidus]|uniref:Peptidase inhibitor family I36 n=1 Tax=Streptomyces candidus TaxID=67283 RepID=A0A7X0HIZ4_9ACTN|nr:peptidase inhibitor family I36 protein [Streptomyces candidus]MBB6438550.1 hypothetical protein [Streptomyces candidus]GHH45494.1 hypothetical protein GCM10018773_35020 [Streptomyces candidus]
MPPRLRALVAVPVAVSALFAASLALAPAAAAEPNPPGCEKEYFCLYAGEGQTGQLLVKTKGNWTGSVAARSAFNNGIPYPNADHVQLTWTYQGATYEQCLHYNPSPDPDHYKLNFAEGVTVTKAVWRGEC